MQIFIFPLLFFYFLLCVPQAPKKALACCYATSQIEAYIIPIRLTVKGAAWPDQHDVGSARWAVGHLACWLCVGYRVGCLLIIEDRTWRFVTQSCSPYKHCDQTYIHHHYRYIRCHDMAADGIVRQIVTGALHNRWHDKHRSIATPSYCCFVLLRSIYWLIVALRLLIQLDAGIVTCWVSDFDLFFLSCQSITVDGVWQNSKAFIPHWQNLVVHCTQSLTRLDDCCSSSELFQ